jgi:hypothetical protein
LTKTLKNRIEASTGVSQRRAVAPRPIYGIISRDPAPSGVGSRWVGIAGLALLALGCAAPGTPQVPEDHSGLTRESFRQKCLLCHASAAPEGVSAEILAGLHPVPGLKPRDAMPNVSCWRRCRDCWGPAHHGYP